MMKHSPVAPVLASALVAALALSACSKGASSDNTASDGRPVVTVQIVKDARTKPMSDLKWTKDLETAWHPRGISKRVLLWQPAMLLT